MKLRYRLRPKSGVIYVSNPLKQGNPLSYYVDKEGNIYEMDARPMMAGELRQKLDNGSLEGSILKEKTDYPGKHAYFIDNDGNVSEFGREEIVFMADIFTKDDKGKVIAENYLKKQKMWLDPGHMVLLPSFKNLANDMALMAHLEYNSVKIDVETGMILEVCGKDGDGEGMAFPTQGKIMYNDGRFYIHKDDKPMMSPGVPLVFGHDKNGKLRIAVMIYSVESAITMHEDYIGHTVSALVFNGIGTSLLTDSEFQLLKKNGNATYVLEEDTTVYYKGDDGDISAQIIPKGTLVTEDPLYTEGSILYLDKTWITGTPKNPIAILTERTKEQKDRELPYARIQMLNSRTSVVNKDEFHHLMRSKDTTIIPRGSYREIDLGNGMKKTFGPGTMLAWGKDKDNDKSYATVVENLDGTRTLVPAVIEICPRALEEEREFMLKLISVDTGAEKQVKGVPFKVEKAPVPQLSREIGKSTMTLGPGRPIYASIGKGKKDNRFIWF